MVVLTGTLRFTEKEFSALRNFQRRMEREFGENSYVGTDYANVLLEYSPELKAMLRPLPPEQHFEFAIKHLHCKCGKGQMFLCLPEQEMFACDECFSKRKKVDAGLTKPKPKAVAVE
jgi:hypothetical protein